ncbi:MAG: MarR family winged helix-turn-helix transcriptional regulator [Verrucomicrobiota bacterium]|jgi:DNA-binding MarR family transcriptional regulator
MTAKKQVFASANLPIDAPGRRRLPILLRHAWYSLNQTFRRRLAHSGLTPDQFTALRTLSEHEPGGLTQSDLTRLMASDPNTVGALAERLEHCGWIARAPHESDRRANRLRLLTAGRREYRRARKIAVALQAEVLAEWSEKKREEFLENLAWLSERCRALADAPVEKPRQKRGRP